MAELKGSRTADQIETALDHTLSLMTDHQKNGNYVEAENHRLLSEQLKKDLEARRVYEMEVRHKRENDELEKAYEDELRNFNSFWNKKVDQYSLEGQRLVKDLDAKHNSEIENTKNDLDKQLSYKVKQSSECLNLKKMEEHMAKQKNYVEAHKVQQRVFEMEKAEKDAWLSARDLKIETALNTLHAKQSTQMANLHKRIKTGLDEQNKDKHIEETRLIQKYGNIEKELKSQHDKEILAYKGHFRSKGGQGSPLLTKSKFLSSR